jgi:hypothetical protein
VKVKLKVKRQKLWKNVKSYWKVMVHKSQGLTLPKAIVDFGEREYAAGLSFVAVS